MAKVEYEPDEVDKNIIEVVQNQPTITQTDIAKKVDRSQPTVGMRVDRLEKMGRLQFQAGLNLKIADLVYAQVEVETKNPEKVLDVVENCPLMVNAFRLSGSRNISIIIVSNKISHLDKVVNYNFRDSSWVNNVEIKIITEILEDFIMPVDQNVEKCDCDIKESCLSCWKHL
jgi:DNA-binding Lrp family transcriptional regulator